MPIEVGPAPSVPPDGKLLLRGLPPVRPLPMGAARRPACGSSLAPDLANLAVPVPAGASGRLVLTLALVGTGDASLAEGHTALSITAPTVVTAGAPAAEAGPHEKAATEPARGDLPPNAARPSTAAEASEASSTPARSRTDAPSPSSSAPAEPVPAPATRGAMLSAPPYAAAIVPAPHKSPRARRSTAAEKRRRGATKMIARGESDLADGNIAVARQFFLRAAEAGVARGALLLASTYDANESARMGAHGVQANATIARMWYGRARELGASEAEALLPRLGGFD